MNGTYNVEYDTSYGKIKEVLKVDKQKKDISSINITIAEVLRINPNQIVKIKNILGSPEPEIKEKDLSLVLVSLYSASISGQNIIDILINTLSDLYDNKDLNNKLVFFKKQGMTIAEIFKRLHIDEAIVTMIDSGSTSGSLAAAFMDARKFINLTIETRKATKSGMGQSLFFFALGLFLVFILPFLVSGFFNEMLNLLGTKEVSDGVKYLNFMSDNIIINIIIIALFTAGIFVLLTNKSLFPITENIPFFSNYYYIVQNKKAIGFLLFYITLNKSGINDEKIVGLYRNIDSDLSNKLIKNLKDGISLSRSVEKAGLPPNVANSMIALIDIRDMEVRDKAFAAVIEALVETSIAKGKKISATLNLVAIFFVFLGILAILFPYQSLLQAGLQTQSV